LVTSFSELELEFKESLLDTLPSELLIHILKWYLYSDMAHLITLRLVCRKMFLLTHEKTLWRLLCEMIHFKDSSMTLFDECLNEYQGDWFAMFLKKPRIKFHGVYISRVNYLRQGYNDTYNQPIHMVIG
jgi:F-box protein 9